MGKDDFKQNRCRLCRNVSCCAKCRIKHETDVHKINPDCDICVVGRTFLKNPPDSLLAHIKEAHWPLHCVRCERVFETLDEINVHVKCDGWKKFAHQTPKRGNEFVIPLISATDVPKKNQLNAIYEHKAYIPTSTPVAKTDDDDQVQIIAEIITPVDCVENVEKKYALYKSSLTPLLRDNKKNDQYSKRRVTFSEHVQSNECSCLKEALQNSEDQSKSINESAAEGDGTAYETADSSSINIPKDESSGTTAEQSSLWQTAIVEADSSSGSDMEFLVAEDRTPNLTLDLESSSQQREDNIPDPRATYIVYPDTDQSVNESVNEIGKSSGLWSSVAGVLRSVVHTLSSTNLEGKSSKRSKPDTEDSGEQGPSLKRMKLTDIQCRRPIRNLRPLLHVKYYKRKVRYESKSTQTDRP